MMIHTRRTLLVWACGLITYSVIRAFENMDKITGPVATALLGVIGILTTVITVWQWARKNEEVEKIRQEGQSDREGRANGEGSKPE